MRFATAFFDSFLDGFTMAGFLHRLRHPAQATRLFAAESQEPESMWRLTFQLGGSLQVAGDLHLAPERNFREMMDLLKERRRDSEDVSRGSAGGTWHHLTGRFFHRVRSFNIFRTRRSDPLLR